MANYVTHIAEIDLQAISEYQRRELDKVLRFVEDKGKLYGEYESKWKVTPESMRPFEQIAEVLDGQPFKAIIFDEDPGNQVGEGIILSAKNVLGQIKFEEDFSNEALVKYEKFHELDHLLYEKRVSESRNFDADEVAELKIAIENPSLAKELAVVNSALLYPEQELSIVYYLNSKKDVSNAYTDEFDNPDHIEALEEQLDLAGTKLESLNINEGLIYKLAIDGNKYQEFADQMRYLKNHGDENLELFRQLDQIIESNPVNIYRVEPRSSMEKDMDEIGREFVNSEIEGILSENENVNQHESGLNSEQNSETSNARENNQQNHGNSISV